MVVRPLDLLQHLIQALITFVVFAADVFVVLSQDMSVVNVTSVRNHSPRPLFLPK
jgi:hypothetical protein